MKCQVEKHVTDLRVLDWYGVSAQVRMFSWMALPVGMTDRISSHTIDYALEPLQLHAISDQKGI